MLFNPNTNPAAGTRQHHNLFIMKKTLYVFVWACCALLALPATAQVPGYVPTDGLVGWWPFNGNANDESGNGNDGVVNGATLTEDRFGNTEAAYGFDGVDDYIIGDSDALPTDERTVSVWFYAISIGEGFKGKHVMGYGGDACGESWLMQIDSWLFQNTYEISGHCNVNGSYSDYGGNHPNGAWHHWVGTSSSTGTVMYLDGILLLSTTESFSSTYVQDRDFLFGAVPYNNGLGFYIDSYSNPWHGSLDDIAIYNRALSQEEITALYTGEPVSPPAACTPLPSNLQQGLVGYWPFCGNANDESGNGNDGTVNGASLTEDRFGNADAAYSFDGVDDFINVLSNDELSLSSDEFSISAWYATTPSMITDNRNMLCKSNGAGPQNKWILMKSEGGGFYPEGVGLHTGPSINAAAFNGFTSVSDPSEYNNWNHILITKFNDSINLYLNGEISSVTSITSNISPSVADLRIGGDEINSVDNAKFWSGQLDDIGIWNRALTPEEVQELYTLDACTFTVYDTTYVTVYDTLTTYETVYDTLYTYETIYDTVTTYVTVTDTLLIDITFTGFEGQPSWLNTVSVFPNPASDHITIDYGNFALMAGYNTIITDAAGATVYSSAVNSQQVEIDINAWGATGVYYMSVYDASGELVAVRHIVLE
jgi:hypothetical protein